MANTKTNGYKRSTTGKRPYAKKGGKSKYPVTKYVKQPVPDGEYSEKITSHH